MTNRYGARGFTLVELLVVIAIIGVLMGLLLPAVQSAREAGRRATCISNQKNIALAMMRSDDINGFLPGWRNAMRQPAGTPVPVSWPVVALPFMERNDIHKSWLAGTYAAPYLAMYVCPSTPPDSMTTPILAYASNCGTANSVRANGVMVDVFGTSVRLSIDDISEKDGNAMTILLAEKCISGAAGLNQNYWDVRPTSTVSFSFANPANPASYVAGSTVVPGFGLAGTASASKVINVATPIGDATTVGQVNTPSSNHPGGAVTAFCAGNVGFLKDSLAQGVYGRLITSDGSAVSGIAADPTWGATAGPLSEGDYK
jgi:prepilin-type N-terminal cleavage/methylation domain-containing protein